MRTSDATYTVPPQQQSYRCGFGLPTDYLRAWGGFKTPYLSSNKKTR